MKPIKKISVILIMSAFLFLIFNFVFLDKVLAAEEEFVGPPTPTSEITLSYPWSGEKTPSGLVAKFYLIALGLAAASALGVLIYGAILWTLSGAVTSKQDALEWIKGALWGLVLLLAAYLILHTINPDLVQLKNPAIEAITPLTQEVTAPQRGQTEFWQGAMTCYGAGWLGEITCSGYTQEQCINDCQRNINDCTLGGKIKTQCTKIRN